MSADTTTQATRHRGGAVPEIAGVRFLPQKVEAELVNISATGLLAESAGRLNVGIGTTVQFEGTFTPRIVSGRVVRCEVAVVGNDGLLRYHMAVEFDTPLALDVRGADAAPASAPVPAVVNRW